MPDGTIACGVARIGIGLRTAHYAEFERRRPALDFLEVHAENYLSPGPEFDRLADLRCDYPLSLHGVGLSLGSAEGIDRMHLSRFRALADATEPFLVSEHLSWSIVGGAYLNDLLPLPYSAEALDIVSCNVDAVQDGLGRQLLIENPSRYLRFRGDEMNETEFLAELVRRTGCALLCDVNNIFVSTCNIGGDPLRYLEGLPVGSVGEIHLAGHAVREVGGKSLLIDDHGAPIRDEVWSLYARAVELFGPVPALVERDRNIPPLDELLGEAVRAGRCHAVIA